jgi:UDP-N-acetylglucosamine 2-epimerase (non-hydrolysing)
VSEEVLLLAGTRAEAVKIAPVVLALAGHPVLRPVVVHSGQRAGVVEQALEGFGLAPDIVLDVPRAAGGGDGFTAGLPAELDRLLRVRHPAVVLVQGDSATALAGALAAHRLGIPVAHLEAGPRPGDPAGPLPGEGVRQTISRVAALHLAATDAAADALRAEHPRADAVVVTGSTAVDAVQHTATAGLPVRDRDLAALETALDETGGRLVLVAVHRTRSREALDRVLHAVRSVADRHSDVRVLLPAPLDRTAREHVARVLGGHERVVVTEPLAHPDLVRALRRSALVLTDSGGLQEEAPSFGVPVLVLSDTSERTPAVDAGCAWLVGTDTTRILAEAGWVLGSRLRLPLGRNPFGDGAAAGRVLSAIERLLGPRAGLGAGRSRELAAAR